MHMWKEEGEETLPEKELLTQLMLVLSFSPTKYSSTHMWKEEEEETLPEKELLTQLMFVLSRTRHGATQPSPTLMLWLPDFLHTTTQKNLE